MSEFKFPTEVIELPSKGLFYPESHPLSKGEIEIKYMTAKEEDILSNSTYIDKGIVLDKLLESVIVDKSINLKDLIMGDYNAILVATRILGYGKEYNFTLKDKEHTVDLTLLKNKEFDTSSVNKGQNSFDYLLPHTETNITFKLISGHDEAKIKREMDGLKKIQPNNPPVTTTRLKHVITSVEGETDIKIIRNFVDTQLLARDARALRNYINEINPDVDMSYILDNGEEVNIPMGISFFWPDI